MALKVVAIDQKHKMIRVNINIGCIVFVYIVANVLAKLRFNAV